ncbi:hypothetical protein [Polaribacter atrinae]|uniref:Uncharacterized protein n=1 Tax=Polaribacter atrinae TaxID=1333662 RepID=A0A176TE51_9FLAO|nr:hypothetical protein [Polaribacter atrinae]OAD45911.1 hypothetical protein LPB303_06385 [Polaribacter atrinae]
MATKVYRLFQDRDLQDWEDRGEPYGPTVIEDINNPDGDYSTTDPTSIPSPFARVDLVRSAFKYVADSNNFDGNTIYHKLVSDCFDVAEMFFNFDKLGDRVQIKTWDKNTDLNNLLTSSNPKHKLLGETLDLFLKQDASSNNFNSLNKLYFIFYDNKIVGGTSPTTLFFTSANDLSFANIENGNDIFFDNDLKPLYKRDIEFQKYIYKLVNGYPELKTKMRDLADYLEKSLTRLDGYNNTLYGDLCKIEEEKTDDLVGRINSSYSPLDIGENNNIEILGVPLKKKKIENRRTTIESLSEFTIISSKTRDKPLVLQNNFTESLIYTDRNVKWDNSWVVPYFDEKPINERTLPGQLDKFPYLTVSDFLQPQIIRVPYVLNSDKYFDGNIKNESGDNNKSFLLPLSKKFFEYFDTEDLQKPLPNGKPMFEAKVFSGSIDVKLRIPIKGNRNVDYITFERYYGSAKSDNKDVENNKGVIIDNKISLAVYPFLKIEYDSFYKIMALDQGVDAVNSHNSLSLKFYSNITKDSLEVDKTSRTLKKDGIIQTDFYSLEQQFDYIEVGYNDNLGIIIPKLKANYGSKKMKFAVDFGTTNTHIEYKVEGDKSSLPFTISKDEIQYETLHSSSTDTDVVEMENFLRHEFLPKIISNNSEFNFPIRTVSGESRSLNFSSTPEAFADINIPFDYEKYKSNIDAEITTNLKWSDFEDTNSPNKIRVEKFIEKILLLIRSKVLFNKGDINKTELIWFYPSSMDPGKIDQLEGIWNTYFTKYFKEGKTSKLSESIAPYYYYQNHGNVIAGTDTVVSIDIGGGTSDVVIFQKEKPIALTSARFAANSIFGDGYGGSPNNNGFIVKYQEKINELIVDNKLTNLKGAFDQISSKKKSEDLVAFFFSLEKNTAVINKKAPLLFNTWLSNDNDLKIVFIVFYSSLIYHIANLMKAKGIDAPTNILFSGTGSKSILITNGSDKLDKLNKLTGLIFDKVFEGNKNHKVKINIEKNPKEITCKGGLEIDVDSIGDIEDIKSVLIGNTEKTTINENPIKYNNISDDLTKSVVSEVDNFIDLLFAIDDSMNFKKYFGVNSAHLDNYKSILKEETLNLLDTGLRRKIESLQGNTNIALEESLFFYPLVGALNKLSYKIVTELNK